MPFPVQFQRNLVVYQDVHLPPRAKLLLFELVTDILQRLPYLQVGFVLGRPCSVALLQHRPLGFWQQNLIRVNVCYHMTQNVLFQKQLLVLLEQLPYELWNFGFY